MNWSEQQLAEVLERTGKRGATPRADVSRPPFKLPVNEAGTFARGRMPDDGMNKTEGAYAQHLEMLKRAGEILWYRYEAIKLRLADGAWFTVDFFVLTRDCVLEAHETKGFWREAARVRIKVVAEIYPFKFIALKKTADGWDREEFS